MTQPGRNAPCPCGSGKKYKHCHLGKPDDGWATHPTLPVSMRPISAQEASKLTPFPGGVDSEFDDLADYDYRFSELDDAWELVEEAWDETNLRKRKRRATSALKKSADCAGAYLILGQLEPDDDKRIALFTQAISVSRQTLLPETLEEVAVDIWDLPEIETAMYGYLYRAMSYFAMNLKNEAITDLKEMLRLDPLDRLNARAHVLLMLMDFGDDDAAEKFSRILASSYAPDVVTTFATALVQYRRFSDSIFSRRTLAEAIIAFPGYAEDLTELEDEAVLPVDPDLTRLFIVASMFSMVPDTEQAEFDLAPPIDGASSLFVVTVHFRLWQQTERARDWVKSVLGAGPNVRYDNGNLGAGPALRLASDQPGSLKHCAVCRQKTERRHLGLVLNYIDGEFRSVVVDAHRCSHCDLLSVDFTHLVAKLKKTHRGDDYRLFAPYGYLPEGVKHDVTADETSEWLISHALPFRSIDDGDARRTVWPTIEEEEERLLEALKEAGLESLVGPLGLNFPEIP